MEAYFVWIEVFQMKVLLLYLYSDGYDIKLRFDQKNSDGLPGHNCWLLLVVALPLFITNQRQANRPRVIRSQQQ